MTQVKISTCNFNSCFYEELISFLNFKTYVYGGKHQHRVVRDSFKHLPHQELRSYLLNKSEPSNIERDFHMEGLGKIIGYSLTFEMCSKRKAARNHLSSQHFPYYGERQLIWKRNLVWD